MTWRDPPADRAGAASDAVMARLISAYALVILLIDLIAIARGT
jgi:hypothetical protein